MLYYLMERERERERDENIKDYFLK